MFGCSVPGETPSTEAHCRQPAGRPHHTRQTCHFEYQRHLVGCSARGRRPCPWQGYSGYPQASMRTAPMTFSEWISGQDTTPQPESDEPIRPVHLYSQLGTSAISSAVDQTRRRKIVRNDIRRSPATAFADLCRSRTRKPTIFGESGSPFVVPHRRLHSQPKTAQYGHRGRQAGCPRQLASGEYVARAAPAGVLPAC